MEKKYSFWTTRLLQRIDLGQAPGAVVVDPAAPAPIIDVLAYGEDDVIEERLECIDDVRRFVNQWPVVWINVTGLGDAEVITAIGKQFNLSIQAGDEKLREKFW